MSKRVNKKKKSTKSTGKNLTLAQMEKPGPPDKQNPGQTLPSLMQAVQNMLPWDRRMTIVNVLAPRYGCSIRTVDRAIKKAKIEFKNSQATTRAERIDASLQKLDAIAKAATLDGRYAASVSAVVARNKLSGDYTERIDVGASMGSAEESMEAAKKLELAAAEALARHRAAK